MIIVLATHNKDKVREMSLLLAPRGFEIKALYEFPGAPEPEETGLTFERNARIKAESASAFTGLPCIADDSGLCVDVLGGAPGVFSARYGGFSTAGERNAHLLLEMGDAAQRDAEFVASIVCLFPDGREICAEGRIRGEITSVPRGAQGFGYDPLFYIPALGRTMAELSEAEKAEVSHRALAIEAFIGKLAAL